MTETFGIPHSASESRVKWGRWQRYLGLGLVFNAAIWGTALHYLAVALQTYTSEWMVILPPAGESSNVSVPGIGVATSSSNSAYGSATYDPRENYKHIAQSETVLRAAATFLDMDLGKFGIPRIKVIDNTTLMQFEGEGASPKEAQLKSLALYKALEARLYQLRTQQAGRKQIGLQTALNFSQNNLIKAQQRLSEYKARSGFTSGEQIVNLSNNIEQLRRERSQILAQLQQSGAHLRQLSTNLKLSAQQATDAFSLQADPQFQQTLSDYGKSSAALVVLSSKYTPNNPAVIDEKAKRDATQAALLARSQSLLGKSVSFGYIQQLSLNNTVSTGSSREKLFQDLVSVQANKQGLQAQAQEVDRQLALLENKLKTLAQQQSKVDDLQRNVQIAEAVFSSTLARLDIGKSDIFGSYPQIQLVKEPSLPKMPSAPNKQFVLLGAALGSLFSTAGLVSLGLRNRPLEPNAGKLKPGVVLNAPE